MDAIHAALGDPFRRALLDALRDGPRSAGELERALRATQPATSKHLRVLREAGLVRMRKDAQRRVYSLDATPLASLDAWLAHYRQFWPAALDRLVTHIEQES